MKSTNMNNDLIPSTEMCNVRSDRLHNWLKERNVKHIKIKDENVLQSVYEFGVEMGQGGFGVVMSIRDKNTSKEWAMKTVNKMTAGDRLKLVQREIQILKLIQHPHIIYLDRVYETSKNVYMILEKCTGELGKIYKESKPFSETLSKKLITQIVSALIYLHKYDIVHRDLKLENILTIQNPDDPRDELYLKLSDFGLSIVKFGTGIDSLLNDYCAPEVITNCPYSQQCDIWALGVMLYMMVVGTHPFYSLDDKELLRKIRNDKPFFPNGRQLSLEVRDLIEILLDKNPVNRLTAAEIDTHPWMTNRPLRRGISVNIIDMLKSTDMRRKESETQSDWISAQTKEPEQTKDASKIVNGVENSKEKLLHVVYPNKPKLHLAKTNILFDGKGTKETTEAGSSTMPPPKSLFPHPYTASQVEARKHSKNHKDKRNIKTKM